MPERAINTKSATGCLLILLPAALTMSALFVAWPVILGVTLLIAGGNLWQTNEWSKTARSIDPVFQQLIVKNRGEITPLDLSIDAKISGSVSNRYLAAKAMEFGTGSRQHPDRGQIYYFVSISTLGSIFDDSELPVPSLMPATTPVVAAEQIASQAEAVPAAVLQSEPTPPVATPIASIAPISSDPIFEPAPTTSELSNLRQLFDETPTSTATPVSEDVAQLPIAEAPPADVVATVPETIAPVADVATVPETAAPTAPPANTPLVKILQSELAKRLDVHSSTVYKRRSEPNFIDWTRNRDPDGLGWGYLEDTKEYYRIDT
jgi:hypothetical protein